jgi:hypothetical protein
VGGLGAGVALDEEGGDGVVGKEEEAERPTMPPPIIRTWTCSDMVSVVVLLPELENGQDEGCRKMKIKL